MADQMISTETIAGKSVQAPVPAASAFDKDGNPINVVVVQAKTPAEIHSEEFHAAERAKEALDKASSYTAYQGKSDNAHVLAALQAKLVALTTEMNRLIGLVDVGNPGPASGSAPAVPVSDRAKVDPFDNDIEAA